jgi:hypothetical protein
VSCSARAAYTSATIERFLDRLSPVRQFSGKDDLATFVVDNGNAGGT